MRRSARARGFTMIEMMVAIAVIAVLLAIAAPIFLQQKPEQNLKDAAADLAANVRYARSLAVSGATVGGMSPDGIEVRFTPPLTYEIVAVQGGVASTPIKVGRLDTYHPGNISMAVAMVAPTNIRFQRNGSADKVALVTLTEAMTGRNRVVEITRAGLARVQ